MRIEKDVLGKVNVPDKALYGSFTVRAQQNFQLSSYKVHPVLILSHALVKKAAAQVNFSLGYLSQKQKNAICKACDEVINGKHADQFFLDPFQAGAGTPINMNVNEVIANRANQIMGGKLGVYDKIHPNNHVNMAQSTNDTIPTSTRLATLFLLEDFFISLQNLEDAFRKKAKQYASVLKTGRTHYEDAVPITVGQELLSFADTLKEANNRVQTARKSLFDLGIGGTAVGTGITTDPQYQKCIVAELKKLTKYPFTPAKNLLHKTQSADCFAEVSSSLKLLAQNIFKICEDLCFLNSGPQAGISEYILLEVEPGSSIMPGKINPSILEAMQMVCLEVIGNDQSVQLGAMHSVLQLNVYTPLIGFKLFESIELLTNGCNMMKQRVVDPLQINKKRCEELLYKSTATATALNPYLGYQVMSSLVHEALKRNMKIKDVVLEKKLINKKDLDRILSPAAMTKPAKIDKKLVEKIKQSKSYQEFLMRL